MNYSLAKELKDAGFPQNPYMNQLCQHGDSMACRISSKRNPECEWVSVPTLSELIEACGKEFGVLHQYKHLGKDGMGWFAAQQVMGTLGKQGSTPEEAVARLFLALNTNYVKQSS